MARNRDKTRNAGFTLIEILVALAILGSAVFLLLETHYRALSLYDETSQEVQIRSFLELAMGNARLALASGAMSAEDDFGERFPDYSYKFETQLAGGDERIPLYTVTVTVTDPQDEEHQIEFFEYVITPVEEGGSGNPGGGLR